MNIYVLIIIAIILKNTVIGNVLPINLAYYVPENNSFVVTCRLTSGVERTPSTCDILIELNQVHAINNDSFNLFANNSEQWVLIRPNVSAIQKFANNSKQSIVVAKMLKFPKEFNINPECFTLRWYTHYSECTKQLQFRILMDINFQPKTNIKCTLHPWSLIYPSFIHSKLSFQENYIEIRFAPNEQAIDDESAKELRNNVQWQFVSMEMTHIYSHQSITNAPTTYYIVTDITDGLYRWYVWKTSRSIQMFLNETLRSLSSQFEKFEESDHFAQIASMLITQRAKTAYTISELKDVLTASDPLQSKRSRGGKKKVDGKIEWTADVPVWDPTVIHIKQVSNACHTIQNGLYIDIESFVIQYQPKGIKRRRPVLPEIKINSQSQSLDTSPVSAPDTIGNMQYVPPINGLGFTPVTHSTSEDVSSADNDYDEEDKTMSNCLLYPVVLQIRGGPEIIKSGKLHVTKIETPEIFQVPQRLSVGSVYTRYYEKKNKRERVPQISGHEKLIHSVIKQSLYDAPDINKPKTTPQIVYIVIYEGYDYGYVAYIISLTMFIAIFVLSCIGFGCIFIQQVQIRRRNSSTSTSSLLSSNSHSGTPRSPSKRRNSSTPPNKRRNMSATL